MRLYRRPRAESRVRQRVGHAHDPIPRRGSIARESSELRRFKRRRIARRHCMELGMIGLGKMGGYMTERLIKGGHRVVGFDRDAATVQQIAGKGAQGANSLESLVTQLK